MEEMWNGAFSPNIRKHRDYLHGSYYSHQLAHGATANIAPTFVMVRNNPVTDDLFEPPREYYMLDWNTHEGSKYLYLVPAESDDSKPNEKRIAETLDEYARNPVDGGRDVNDYIDFDSGVAPEVVEWMVANGHADKVDFRYEPPVDDEFNL